MRREEFERWRDVTPLPTIEAHTTYTEEAIELAWQAATSSTAAKYQSRVAELEEALQPFAENIPEDYKAPCHSGITTARKCGRCSRAYKAYLALNATSSTSAKYQARVKDLEKFAEFVRDNSDEEWTALANKALSTTSPDQALQQVVLEARIDEHRNHTLLQHRNVHRQEQLRAELAALEGEKT